MNAMPEILNQQETAEYISEALGKNMDSSTLSKLTSNGGGPPFDKKGNQKLFLKRDVDRWIDQEKQRRKTA